VLDNAATMIQHTLLRKRGVALSTASRLKMHTSAIAVLVGEIPMPQPQLTPGVTPASKFSLTSTGMRGQGAMRSAGTAQISIKLQDGPQLTA
jgi:hypothetical protein